MKRPSNWSQMSKAERRAWYRARHHPKPTEYPYQSTKVVEHASPGAKQGVEIVNQSARFDEMTVSARNARRLSGLASRWLANNDPLINGELPRKKKSGRR